MMISEVSSPSTSDLFLSYITKVYIFRGHTQRIYQSKRHDQKFDQFIFSSITKNETIYKILSKIKVKFIYIHNYN